MPVGVMIAEAEGGVDPNISANLARGNDVKAAARPDARHVEHLQDVAWQWPEHAFEVALPRVIDLQPEALLGLVGHHAFPSPSAAQLLPFRPSAPPS